MITPSRLASSPSRTVSSIAWLVDICWYAQDPSSRDKTVLQHPLSWSIFNHSFHRTRLILSARSIEEGIKYNRCLPVFPFYRPCHPSPRLCPAKQAPPAPSGAVPWGSDFRSSLPRMFLSSNWFAWPSSSGSSFDSALARRGDRQRRNVMPPAKLWRSRITSTMELLRGRLLMGGR